MRLVLLLFTVLCFLQAWAQDTLSFRTSKEMADYAFSESDFSNMPSKFLLNRSMEIDRQIYERFLSGNTDFVTGENTIGLFSLLQWWDTQDSFERDKILFPVFDHIMGMDQETELHIPLFVTDLNVMQIENELWSSFKASANSEPFPAIHEGDYQMQHFETASIFLDSLSYTSNVVIDFGSPYLVSNTGRVISEIYLRSDGNEKTIYPGQSVAIGDWLSDRTIEIEVNFTDGTSFTKSQNVFWSSIKKEKSDLPEFWNTVHRQYYNPSEPTSIQNPEAKYSVFYACPDEKIRKPFFMIAGWGTDTDIPLINHNQNWPTPMFKLVTQFNEDGLLENLHSQGFDIVFLQFNPPNASIIKNCGVLEKVINEVNNQKFANGSYEENTVMGVSAGALAAKLTLQIMEKKHLDEGGPHPHTRLFISYDGENKGANVPLGMQHAVKYLWDYEYNNFPTDYNTYALNYILNAPLSQELLVYFHSATGYGDAPGQGCDVARTQYLQYHDWNNHSLNGHIPGYPSFQRNISISNGASVPDYNFTNFTCNHDPYPQQTGAIFFKQSGSLMGWVNRRFEATFLTHGVHRVFYYEYKPLFKSWKVGYEAKTNNPTVYDNAPGGIIFIKQNPIRNINDELRSELTGSPSTSEDYLFSFTPTVLTHDVRNLSSSMINGYPNYDFKNNNLMYDNEAAAAAGSPTFASDYFGYPHLGYPNTHYDYTPFDALFTWSQNTEHLIGNRKSPNVYDSEYSEVRPRIKNFMVSEAEGWNIMLQNKRIGYYARPDYVYHVDYEALNGIYLGKHITDKTDYIECTIEPNAVVEMQAANEIIFKSGVHIKTGSIFHAFIGDPSCEKSAVEAEDGNNNANGVTIVQKSNVSNSDVHPIVYPNPNKNSFAIAWNGLLMSESIHVIIYNFSGKELLNTKTFVGSELKHELMPGLYLISIQNGDSCYSTRIVIE